MLRELVVNYHDVTPASTVRQWRALTTDPAMDWDRFRHQLGELISATPASQASVAREADVSPSYVTLLLKGERPNVGLETLERVVRAAGGKMHVDIAPAAVPIVAAEDKLAPLLAVARDLDADSIAYLARLAPDIADTTDLHKDIISRMVASDAAAARAARQHG